LNSTTLSPYCTRKRVHRVGKRTDASLSLNPAPVVIIPALATILQTLPY
jgi:hypothetical protein